MKTFASILEQYGLISEYASYTDKVMVHCPFHLDHTPSLSINFVFNNFRCFSCGVEGKAFDLIYALEQEIHGQGLSVIQLAIRASKIVKGVEEVDPLELERRMESVRAFREKHQSKEELESVYLFYKSLKKVDWETAWDDERAEYWHYLNHDRGLDCSTLNDFHVRLNVTSVNPICIPLIEQGMFKGYVSRRIDTGKVRKYKNNNGLDKANIVVGNLVESGYVVVVEGIVDAMMSHQNGYSNVACLLGCSSSQVQLEKVARYSDTIVWALDGDNAGDKGYAIAKQFYTTRYPNKKLVRFQFPDGKKDPGELTKKETEACMKKALSMTK
jgi:DNA primase